MDTVCKLIACAFGQFAAYCYFSRRFETKCPIAAVCGFFAAAAAVQFAVSFAGLAALNATNKQKEEIMRQCELVEGLIKRRAPYYSEDMEFHRLLAQASGNVVMMQLVPILHHAIGKNIDRTNNELAGETVIWHKNIAVAVQRSDAVGARNAMFIHIELNRRMIYEKIVAGKNAAAR